MLITIEEYQKLTGGPVTLAEALAQPESSDVRFRAAERKDAAQRGSRNWHEDPAAAFHREAGRRPSPHKNNLPSKPAHRRAGATETRDPALPWPGAGPLARYSGLTPHQNSPRLMAFAIAW